MIRHIVMWKFREGTEREQEQFLTGLRGLFGVIPQLRRCEVKRCVGKDNYDAVLVSEFASMEDLQTYKDDPRHKAVSALCKSIRIDRVAADYEICYRRAGRLAGSLFFAARIIFTRRSYALPKGGRGCGKTERRGGAAFPGIFRRGILRAERFGTG